MPMCNFAIVFHIARHFSCQNWIRSRKINHCCLHILWFVRSSLSGFICAYLSLPRECSFEISIFLTTPVSTNFLKILWEFIQGFFPVQYGANEFVRIQFCLIKSKICPKLQALDFLKIFKSSWCWNICWNGQSSFRGLSWKRLNPKHTLKNYTSKVFLGTFYQHDDTSKVSSFGEKDKRLESPRKSFGFRILKWSAASAGGSM